MSNLDRQLRENLARVREQIATAAARSGRSPDAITLVAVTKYVSAEVTAAVIAAGCHDLGESRPQQLWEKAEQLADPTVRWHLVGHLQRNKIRRTLPLLHLLQSVDSQRLIEALETEAAALAQTANVLVEVNVSGDNSKTGLVPDDLPRLIDVAARCPHVQVHGLMGMSRLDGTPDEIRQDFARLRECAAEAAKSCPPNIALNQLSMGMSDDFEIAIEQGATIVRVGSALFENLENLSSGRGRPQAG